MRRAHVVGAGLAGLSAAVRLAEAGFAVVLHEAGPAAGGRCRSYFDRALGCRIDNGNHLLLSGNEAALSYLDTIGARATLTGPGRAVFPFIDLATGERWTVTPGDGRIPWWVLDRRRRVPGTGLAEYLALARLRGGGADATVAGRIAGSVLYDRLLEPLAVSALNTRPEEGLARLLWAVVEGSLLRGGRACVPLVPRIGLSESFVDPALAWLQARGAVLHTSRRVTALAQAGGRVTALATTAGDESLGPDDAVVLAVPPWLATDLLPGLSAPETFEAILNLHFRAEADPGPAGFMGCVGGLTEWVFVKPGVVSVTISAANRLLDRDTDELAATVWDEVCRSVGLSGPMPALRVVREKRATFAATAANERLRPGPLPPNGPRNLVIAGDWTATGLPATIEGAIRSGFAAARILQNQ